MHKLASHAVDDVIRHEIQSFGFGPGVFHVSGRRLVQTTRMLWPLDPAGNVYVTGRTNSSDFPLMNPIQTTRTAFDMFVTEINAAGSAVLFSTFLGGSGSESGRGIAVDRLGNIHIAGEGTSTDFPVKNAFQGTSGGGSASQDALVLLLGDTPPSNGPVITTVSDNLIDGGAVTPGGWFYVKGTDLAETTRIWGGSDFYFASRQLSPTPTSTTSGTFSWQAPSISRFTSFETASTSSGGHSNTSSSCTCSSIALRYPPASSAASMRTMASLIRSAAVPCSGEFTAVRSANRARWGCGC
jgi:hypothetical protein